MRRFNIIREAENSDFDRAIILENDRSRKADLCKYLAIILAGLGLLTVAYEYQKKGMTIHEDLNDRIGVAGDYENMGSFLGDMGSHDESLVFYKKALDIYEELTVGGTILYKEMAGVYANIGVTLERMGNHETSLDYRKKAMTIHEDLNDRFRMASDYSGIGVPYLAQVILKKA